MIKNLVKNSQVFVEFDSDDQFCIIVHCESLQRWR